MHSTKKVLLISRKNLELLKNLFSQGLIRSEMNLKKKLSKDLAKTIGDQFEDLYPLIVWLREAVR